MSTTTDQGNNPRSREESMLYNAFIDSLPDIEESWDFECFDSGPLHDKAQVDNLPLCHCESEDSLQQAAIDSYHIISAFESFLAESLTTSSIFTGRRSMLSYPELDRSPSADLRTTISNSVTTAVDSVLSLLFSGIESAQQGENDLFSTPWIYSVCDLPLEVPAAEMTEATVAETQDEVISGDEPEPAKALHQAAEEESSASNGASGNDEEDDMSSSYTFFASEFFVRPLYVPPPNSQTSPTTGRWGILRRFWKESPP